MSKEKPKRIVKHGCYSALNADLGIRDRYGKLMKGEHDVFVIKNADRDGFVIVKTITSLENIKKDGAISFHLSALNNVKKGLIIPIPDKEIGANKLSGIHRKPIRIHKRLLFKSKNKYKYPKDYDNLIAKNKK